MTHSESRDRWVLPMKPRSPDETHRAATPLELFFDLVFVVAVAQAAIGLHHGISEDHAAETIPIFLMVFFGIWWAWMTFTWFATSYDPDDIPYRVLVFVQMTGALVVAAGVESLFAKRDLTIIVVGYVVMRVAGVAQWLRAAQADHLHRPAALRYAIGITLCQAAWVLLLAVPKDVQPIGFVVLVLVELLIPVWAERPSPTPWHVHHIRERYGLFTILVLGETILSTSNAIRISADEGGLTGSLGSVIIGALLIVYAMWWLYFFRHTYLSTESLRWAFVWAYAHYFVFAATAAVGAGLAVVIDQLSHHAEISVTAAGMAVAIPSAIYVVSLWILQEHPLAKNKLDAVVHPLTAVLVLLTPFTGQAVLFTGILLTGLVAIRLVRHLE